MTTIADQMPEDLHQQPEISAGDYKTLYLIMQAITQWATNIGLTVNEDGELVVQTSIDATGATLNVPADVGISGDALTALQGLDTNVSVMSIDLSLANTLLVNVENGIDEAIAAISAVETDVETVNTNLGTLEDDVEASNALLTTIDADTSTILTNSGNIATYTNRIPEQGQALADASTPVVLPALQAADLKQVTEANSGDILTALQALNTVAYAKKKVVVSGYPKAFTGTQSLTVTGTNYSVTNTSSTDTLRVQVGDADFSLKPGYGVDEVDCAQFTEMTLTPSSSSGTGIVIVKA